MEQIAALPAEKRAVLFQETAKRRSMSDAIVEKDFWVCWTLGRLFADLIPQNSVQGWDFAFQGIQTH